MFGCCRGAGEYGAGDDGCAYTTAAACDLLWRDWCASGEWCGWFKQTCRRLLCVHVK